MKSKDYTVIGQDIPFERIRRITGYLVGSVDRFNNAKKTAKKGFGIIRLLLIWIFCLEWMEKMILKKSRTRLPAFPLCLKWQSQFFMPDL